MLLKKRIAIIGAGWFGCYLGLVLKKKYEVKIFEKRNKIFLGASGNNQNRLHQGFHYPRSYLTIKESKIGFKKFIDTFPFLTKKINKNYYLISNNKKNLLDFEIYKQILKSNGLKFNIIKKNKFFFNISGIINSKERLIDTNKSKIFFLKNLKKNIIFNTTIKNIKNDKKKKIKIINNKERFDYIINTTWETFRPIKENNYKYEACIFFLYKCKTNNHPSITIMDGPFLTLYQSSDNYFTLYSVKFSRIKMFSKFSNCEKFLNKIPKYTLNTVRKHHEKQMYSYYPDFKKNFIFKKNLITYRTLIETSNAERSSKVYSNNGVINVLSGKIDHIFEVGKTVKKCLKY